MSRERLTDYEADFFGRLIRVEGRMDALEDQQGKQTELLHEIKILAVKAEHDRDRLIERVERIEPTIRTIKEALTFAQIGRKFTLALGAIVAAVVATVAGIAGGWGWVAQLWSHR